MESSSRLSAGAFAGAIGLQPAWLGAGGHAQRRCASGQQAARSSFTQGAPSPPPPPPQASCWWMLCCWPRWHRMHWGSPPRPTWAASAGRQEQQPPRAPPPLCSWRGVRCGGRCCSWSAPQARRGAAPWACLHAGRHQGARFTPQRSQPAAPPILPPAAAAHRRLLLTPRLAPHQPSPSPPSLLPLRLPHTLSFAPQWCSSAQRSSCCAPRSTPMKPSWPLSAARPPWSRAWRGARPAAPRWCCWGGCAPTSRPQRWLASARSGRRSPATPAAAMRGRRTGMARRLGGRGAQVRPGTRRARCVGLHLRHRCLPGLAGLNGGSASTACAALPSAARRPRPRPVWCQRRRRQRRPGRPG